MEKNESQKQYILFFLTEQKKKDSVNQNQTTALSKQ